MVVFIPAKAERRPLFSGDRFMIIFRPKMIGSSARDGVEKIAGCAELHVAQCVSNRERESGVTSRSSAAGFSGDFNRWGERSFCGRKARRIVT